MTAQPNDRAVDVLAHIFRGYVATFPGEADLILAAVRDALARGGDDADAMAQAIGLRGEDRVRYQGWPIPPERSRRYVTEWRGVES